MDAIRILKELESKWMKRIITTNEYIAILNLGIRHAAWTETCPTYYRENGQINYSARV